jgi:uncharacterized protein (TIGR02246 family)
MSKPTGIGLFTLSLLACATSAQTPGATALSGAQSARDPRLTTLDALRAAVEVKDARAVAALYADDAVVEPMGGRAQHGRAAIEAATRAEFEPAASIRLAFPRVWLKDDVAIVEAVFRATHPPASGLHDVGQSEAITFWFDHAGKITHERSYQEQEHLDDQAAGDPGADPLPEIPATTEVHVATSGADDARTIAWANDMEAQNSASDAHMIASLAEPFRWDCSLGFHSSSRPAFAKALASWRTRFPDEKYVATNVWPVGDYVVVEELFTGTHEGDIGPLKASHHPVSWHWLEIWQVKDGKIARGWSWTNFGELLPQIALEPPQSLAKARSACSVEP